MPVWKFSQGEAGISGGIGVTAGLSVSFEADSPYREIAQAVGLSGSFWVEQTDYGIAAGIALDVSFDALHLIGDLTAGIGLSAETEAEAEFLASIASSIGLQASMEAVSLSDSFPGEIGLQGTFQGNLESSRNQENVVSLAAAFECLNLSQFFRDYGEIASKRYFFTLTGSNNGLEDVVIPISSIQSRIRSGEPSYLSVVIPGIDYASAINARPNGELVIEMAYYLGSEELIREEIVRADLEDIDIYRGSESSSIVLTGHRTVTWVNKSVELQGITYVNIRNGKYRVRCAFPDLYLRPGDTVKAGEGTFTADLITLIIGNNLQTMEVAEA